MRAEIREACTADAEDLARVAKRSLAEAWSADAFREALDLASARGLVAEASPLAGVVGFVIGRRLLDQIEIQTVAVDPDWRRRGLGRKLLEWFLARARAEGIARATLEVRRSNTAALKLYAGLGFTVQGIRRRYYSDAEDALLLDADLGGDRR